MTVENMPEAADTPEQAEEISPAETAKAAEAPGLAEQAGEQGAGPPSDSTSLAGELDSLARASPETSDQQLAAAPANAVGPQTTAPPTPMSQPDEKAGEDPGNLELMMDLPLEVVVELGQASLPLTTVLSLGPGSVIELTRRPGEPLDLYVNGQLMARGEVVVLNETFAFRVSEIVSAAELKMLGR